MSTPYDDVADWYDAVLRQGTIVQEAALRALEDICGDVSGQRVCDLACGQGAASRAMAARGAHVVGIDTSAKLLDIAIAEEVTTRYGIEFAIMNAETLAELPSGSFDGVICNLALMDISDLAATGRSVERVLRPGGWFAFTIMHPCFQTPESSWRTEDGSTGRLVRAYFVEGPWRSKTGTGMRARIGAVHRTLSSYINTLSAAGLSLESMQEPKLAREPGKAEPAYDEVPALLAARLVKS